MAKQLLNIESAQHSVHLTLGSLRIFWLFLRFSLFRSDSVLPPAPAQLMQTVGCLAINNS
jgi:hypothetical protein